MKCIIALVFVVLSMPTFAAETNTGYVACRYASDLDLVIAAASSGDQDSFKALVDGAKCLVLGPKKTVTVIDYPGVLGGKTSFMFRGIKFWTVREGLNFDPE